VKKRPTLVDRTRREEGTGAGSFGCTARGSFQEETKGPFVAEEREMMNLQMRSIGEERVSIGHQRRELGKLEEERR